MWLRKAIAAELLCKSAGDLQPNLDDHAFGSAHFCAAFDSAFVETPQTDYGFLDDAAPDQTAILLLHSQM